MSDSPLLRACVPGVRGECCWNCSSVREPNARLSTLPSSNPRSCMKNSILVVFSFGGFNSVMSCWHFFFKLFEIANELAKLLMAPLYYQQSFQHFNSFSIIIRIPRAELLRIPTCILQSTLSIKTCLEKRLKDPNLRWVLPSMSWKFARIVIGVCFSSKSQLKTDLLVQ